MPKLPGCSVRLSRTKSSIPNRSDKLLELLLPKEGPTALMDKSSNERAFKRMNPVRKITMSERVE
jgi:hypothetical protein